jgi:hypothetical protein
MSAAVQPSPPERPTPPRDENDRRLDPSPPPTTDQDVDIAGTEADEKKVPPPSPAPERQDR